MKREEALSILTAHQKEIRNFRVKSLLLFGSVARDEAGSDSDVDSLVEFDKSVVFFEFMRLQRYLEAILVSSVDLGTPNSLRPYLRESVIEEAVRAI